MEDCGTAEAPESLETNGLATCIGVAIIYGNRGFIMHSPGIIMEFDTVTGSFFALLNEYIPVSTRGKIIPVLAGGCLERDTGDLGDKEIRGSTLRDRASIRRQLTRAGFAPANACWARPHQAQSLYLDLERRIIKRVTDDVTDLDSPPEIEQIGC